MRVVIAGAGSVGRSIARELLGNGHQVLLIDKDADDVQASRVPEASWLLADACEIAALEEARLEERVKALRERYSVVFTDEEGGP